MIKGSSVAELLEALTCNPGSPGPNFPSSLCANRQ